MLPQIYIISNYNIPFYVPCLIWSLSCFGCWVVDSFSFLNDCVSVKHYISTDLIDNYTLYLLVLSGKIHIFCFYGGHRKQLCNTPFPINVFPLLLPILAAISFGLVHLTFLPCTLVKVYVIFIFACWLAQQDWWKTCFLSITFFMNEPGFLLSIIIPLPYIILLCLSYFFLTITSCPCSWNW